MLVSSRSYDEYVAFFDLTDADLATTILDCSAGGSAFAAVTNARGGRVTAVDPAYGDPAGLREGLESGMRDGTLILDAHSDRFVWEWYGTPERRTRLRQESARRFIRDFESHPGTYVAGTLPELPFPSEAFELALCSHLLFTWADTFDEAWHTAALLELLRVAQEVRVFPLVLQGDGLPVEFLPRVVRDLRARGFTVEVRRVEYEFQRGANEMLVASRRPTAS